MNEGDPQSGTAESSICVRLGSDHTAFIIGWIVSTRCLQIRDVDEHNQRMRREAWILRLSLSRFWVLGRNDLRKPCQAADFSCVNYLIDSVTCCLVYGDKLIRDVDETTDDLVSSPRQCVVCCALCVMHCAVCVLRFVTSVAQTARSFRNNRMYCLTMARHSPEHGNSLSSTTLRRGCRNLETNDCELQQSRPLWSSFLSQHRKCFSLLHQAFAYSLHSSEFARLQWEFSFCRGWFDRNLSALCLRAGCSLLAAGGGLRAASLWF
jgi:hypothetical protein